MPSPSQPVRLSDIASEVGVSLGTVSRILRSDSSKFAEKTVTRVHEAARRLNYRPNATARNLAAGGKTLTAGVIMPSYGFYGRIVAGINQILFEHQHAMLMIWNPLENRTPDDDSEARVIHQVVERRVDGVILVPLHEQFDRAYFEEIWQRDIPLILVDREMSHFKADFVGSDDQGLGAAAARYLADLGHRRLLFVPGVDVSTARLRGQGFRDAVSEMANVSCRQPAPVAPALHDWSELRALMQQPDRPTGIFAYGDSMAARLIRKLRSWGLRIPEDVSVIGAGDQEYRETLTTFDQHPDEIGRQAAKLYLERVDADSPVRPPAKTVRIPATLIPRSSTAPLRSP